MKIDDELSAYVDDCYEFENNKKLEDVYVTDHKPLEKKYLTRSEEE